MCMLRGRPALLMARFVPCDRNVLDARIHSVSQGREDVSLYAIPRTKTSSCESRSLPGSGPRTASRHGKAELFTYLYFFPLAASSVQGMHY